jgi:hypothetical protein
VKKVETGADGNSFFEEIDGARGFAFGVEIIGKKKRRIDETKKLRPQNLDGDPSGAE